MAHGQGSESPCPLGADRWRGTHLRELARTKGVYLGPEYGAALDLARLYGDTTGENFLSNP